MKKFFLIPMFFCIVAASFLSAQDDGTFSKTWLPQELTSLKETAFYTRVEAKYEPDDGAHYYVIQTFNKTGDMPYLYYKVEHEDVQLIGQKNDVDSTPFGEFIQDAKVVDALWDDYLSRWTKAYGRETIQKWLDSHAHDVITKEEVAQFTRAGFRVPATATIIANRQDVSLENLPK